MELLSGGESKAVASLESEIVDKNVIAGDSAVPFGTGSLFRAIPGVETPGYTRTSLSGLMHEINDSGSSLGAPLIFISLRATRPQSKALRAGFGVIAVFGEG